MNRQQAFFLALLLTGLGIAALMLAPYLPYLLAGVLLAFVARPLQRRLSPPLPSSVAAGLVVFLTVLLAVLPVLVMIGAVADDAATLARAGSLDQVPSLHELESLIEEFVGYDIDLTGHLRAGLEAIAGWAAGSVSGIVGAAVTALIGVSLMLIVQFYAVRDWTVFANWTRRFDVLPTDIQNRVYRSTGRATWSVVKGHVFVAILQGLVAGLGLWLASIPNAIFWTFMMIILAFIPIIGSMLIWAPAGLYLVWSGELLPGIGLLIYGFILVGVLDNLSRPLLIDESVNLNDLFILLGVIGGVSVFGPVGLFVGPVAFAVLAELHER